MSKIILYTKDNCTYCNQAKNLLHYKGKSFTEVKIGVDMTREDFVSLFPNIKSVPHIIIDGVQIGGYDKLQEWVTDQGRTFLTEGMAS